MKLVNLYIEHNLRGFKKTAGWYGYVLECENSKGEVKTVDGFEQISGVTPNQAVLITLSAALDRMNQPADIIVYTDNQYVSENFLQRLDLWAENGWKNVRGEEIKNRELWQQVYEKADQHNISFGEPGQHPYKDWLKTEILRRVRN